MSNQTQPMARKEQKQKEKEEARKHRNADQAQEESKAWESVNQKAKANLAVYEQKKNKRVSMTQEVANELLARLTAGLTLTAICKMPDMPHPSTVYEFMQKSPAFAENYARACGGLATLLFHECLEIADNDTDDIITNDDTGEKTVNHAAVQRARLKIDTRMRMAGKLNGKYADKPLLGDNGKVHVTNNTLSINARDMTPDHREQLRALLLQARASTDTIDV